jgi:hypothetical protein
LRDVDISGIDESSGRAPRGFHQFTSPVAVD